MFRIAKQAKITNIVFRITKQKGHPLMAFVKVPEELLDLDITPGQLKILINLIRYSFDDGHSYIGYAKLAKSCKTDKSALIKNIQKLAQLKLIEITHRGTFSRSNDIKLTFENGLLNSGRMSEGNSGQNTTKGCLNDTPKGCLNDTPRGCLNDTQGCLNDTPHKDIRFKYQDLNLNTREKGSLNDTPRGHSNNIAPDDMTSGRSMPSQQAGEGLAKRVCAEPLAAKDEVLSVWRDCEAHFKDISADLELFQVGKSFGIRKKSKFALTDDIRAQEVQSWLSERGIIATVIDSGKHYLGEIVIGR